MDHGDAEPVDVQPLNIGDARIFADEHVVVAPGSQDRRPATVIGLVAWPGDSPYRAANRAFIGNPQEPVYQA